MLFNNLTKMLTFERNHLWFVRSRDDWNIIVAIGHAAEQSEPIGFKQLVLLKVASPSTLTRKLKQLITDDVICRDVQPHDGRMVTYSLTKPTIDALRRYERLLRGLRW
jgi:DNA-binding HxlR family transcriptional regulator